MPRVATVAERVTLIDQMKHAREHEIWVGYVPLEPRWDRLLHEPMCRARPWGAIVYDLIYKPVGFMFRRGRRTFGWFSMRMDVLSVWEHLVYKGEKPTLPTV